MSDVEKRAADRTQARRYAAAAGGTGAGGHYLPVRPDPESDMVVERIANHGVLLPADPRIFAPRALAELRRGRFDRRNARQRPSLVANGDRLLEIGAGVCFLPVLSVLLHPELTALVQERRADLAEVGRDVAAAHGLGPDRIRIVEGPSSGPDIIADFLRDLREEFRPTVVVLDEIRISLDHITTLIGPGLRRIVITSRAGWTGCSPGALTDRGFRPFPARATAGSLVFDSAEA
jgi:hypothetical protein